MDFFQEIFTQVVPLFKNLYVQMGLLLAFATLHGYAGAWLAVRMLFRPRHPFKILGLTVFPQGMIPRHRDRLAAAIGKAVGEELVSQETILQELTGKDFLRKKIQNVVDSYTDDLLSQEYPSLLHALPETLREQVLEGISSLQNKLALHVTSILQSEESRNVVRSFVSKQVDDVLGQRVAGVVTEETFEAVITFLDGRVRSALSSRSFETTLTDFINRRIDELTKSETPLGKMFTADAIDLLKEKAGEQIEPAIHHLTELAAAEKTRHQIGALIKHEVHDYYEGLPFFKKIFVSRENLLSDVDELVNESLPKRIEETLRGEFFAHEAATFINASIDNALQKPLPVVLGQVASEQLDRLKAQVTKSVLTLLRREETITGVTAYFRETLEKFRPHSIDAILQLMHSESEEKLKSLLSNGLLNILGQEETSRIINEMLAVQVERLVSKPIGRLSDHISESKVREASAAVANTIVAATTARLPEAIAEFDVAGLVQDKIHGYPPEKLEALVLSVAKEHLHKIELFGALFGLLIGIVQVIQFYIYAN